MGKRLFFVASAMMMFVSTIFVFAGDNEVAPIRFDVATSFSSAYIGLCGVTNSEKSNIQTIVRVTHKNGVYGEIFVSTEPAGGLHDSFGDETDYTIGLSRNKGSITTNLSSGFYDVHNLVEKKGNDFAFLGGKIIWFLGKINNSDFSISVGGKMEKNWAVEPKIMPGGLWWGVFLDGVLPLEKERIKGININIFTGGHNGLYGFSRQNFSHIAGFVSINLKTGPAMITPVLNYQIAASTFGNHASNPIAKNKIWPSVNISFSF